MEAEKTLKVYSNNSVFTFRGLFREYLWEVDDCGRLIIYSRGEQGLESIIHFFNTWDYFSIESE